MTYPSDVCPALSIAESSILLLSGSSASSLLDKRVDGFSCIPTAGFCNGHGLSVGWFVGVFVLFKSRRIRLWRKQSSTNPARRARSGTPAPRPALNPATALAALQLLGNVAGADVMSEAGEGLLVAVAPLVEEDVAFGWSRTDTGTTV